MLSMMQSIKHNGGGQSKIHFVCLCVLPFISFALRWLFKTRNASWLFQDSPRDTTIDPSDAVIHVDRELTCTTRASPDAHAYEWFRDETDSVGVGQTYVIPEEWLGQYVTLTCIATNTVGSDGVSIFFSVVGKCRF